MRVVVLTTSATYTPGVRLLAALAAGLTRRGDLTALACLSRGPVETAIEQEWPRLRFRAIVGAGFVRRLASVRGIMTALRPTAVLVGSEEDASLASVAMGAHGGVVRRLTVSESATSMRNGGDDATAPARWHRRLMRSHTRYEAWGARALAVSWPAPAPDAARDDPSVQALPVSSANVVIVPAAIHDAATALALRAASHLRTRMPEMRLTLLGAPAALQATRLHAASLALTNAVQILPLDTLLRHTTRDALAVWVCAAGDEGAVATLAAMQQRLPVVMPADAAFADLLVPGVTGFFVTAETLTMVVAALARVSGDATVAEQMGAAAAARAAGAFGWEAFVDGAAEHLARVGGR
jgi:hypothetical protein